MFCPKCGGNVVKLDQWVRQCVICAHTFAEEETVYTVKSTRIGKATHFQTIQEVLEEVKRVLLARDGGMTFGKIIIERQYPK